MPIIKLSASERRKLSAFFTCLALAVVAWVFVTLSGTYSFTTKQVLEFRNAPQHRAFQPLQADTINVTQQGTGWEMLFSRMNNGTQPISIDLHTLEHNNFIALNTQLAVINKSRDPQHRITGFDPDTLYFDFTNRSIKKIKVEPLLNIKYQPQYAVSGRIVVKPAYITINGPSNFINQVKTWKTDSLTLKNVNQSFDARLSLKPVHEGNINIYPKSVNIHVPVEEFTEKTLSIPVKIIKNDHYYNVKIFPQRVKVTFTTPLSRYAELDGDFFEATADISLWQQGYTTLPVHLSRIPAYCKIVSIEPGNIDFLIKK